MLFVSVKPIKEKEIVERLSILKEHIVGGAGRFGFLRDIIEYECEPSNCEVPPPKTKPEKAIT